MLIAIMMKMWDIATNNQGGRGLASFVGTMNYIPLDKGQDTPFEQNRISFTKACSVLGSVEICPVALKKIVCLFVCMEFIIPLENFSLIWKPHHCRWRSANFDLCSALMAIEQWGFFNVPHLLWHGPTIYNGNFRGPVKLIPVAERLAVELLVNVFMTWVCRDRGSNHNLPHASSLDHQDSSTYHRSSWRTVH